MTSNPEYDVLMNLADNMAAAAVEFSSHGYDMFIQAREQFKETLESIFAKVKVDS